MSKEDFILRSEVHIPLTTKNSELSYKESDDNTILSYQQFVLLSQSSNVDLYDISISYSNGRYVFFNSQLWKMIALTPQINITPGTDEAIWIGVYASDLVEEPTGIKTFEKTITSAEVLALGVVPINLIPTPGPGKAIEVLSGVATILFEEGSPSGTPYTANITLSFGFTGALAILFQIQKILSAEAKQTMPFEQLVEAYTPVKAYICEDESFAVAVAPGNPLAGDSNVLIQGTYRIIDIPAP